MVSYTSNRHNWMYPYGFVKKWIVDEVNNNNYYIQDFALKLFTVRGRVHRKLLRKMRIDIHDRASNFSGYIYAVQKIV